MQNNQRSRKKILIIEDQPLHQKIFENLLSRTYDLFIVKTLDEATKILESENPQMMIMDIHIDGFDGKSCLEYPTLSIPVVATSASADMSTEGYQEFGFSGFIKKPASARETLKIVDCTLKETPQQLKEKENNTALNQQVVKELLSFNSEEKLISIYQDFILETRDLLDRIESSLIDNSEQKTIEVFHTIKGNSGTLGAQKIQDLSTKAQEFARDHKTVEAMKFIPIIRKEVGSLEMLLEGQTIFNNGQH